MPDQKEHDFLQLKAFFDRDVAQKATKPLREGLELAVYINGEGPITLSKHGGRIALFASQPTKPDMSFWATSAAIEKLSNLSTEEVGEVGIEICKLMLASDPALQMKAKVHIGTFDLLRNGYLGVIPLGGTTLMKFLASNGFNGIGKIKDAITRLRS